MDNNPDAYAYQPENALPILSWYNNYNDKELYKLIPLLSRLSHVNDVREYIPKIVDKGAIRYYRAFKLLRQMPRESPLNDFINGLKNLKTEAFNFFSTRKESSPSPKINMLRKSEPKIQLELKDSTDDSTPTPNQKLIKAEYCEKPFKALQR